MNISKASLTSVSADDITLVLRELEGANDPVSLDRLAEKVAFAKTAGQRMQSLKKYDPNAKYEIGDLIYKEYNETLNIGSKMSEPFEGAVVLEVISKMSYKDYNCDMLEVDYSGGGVFRKYIEYMKKTKTQVLLPSNYAGQDLEPALLPKNDDPRLNELPMPEAEIRKLTRNMRSELAKHTDIFGWNDHYQLTSRRVEIEPAKVAAIEKHLVTTAKSARTEELVEKFLGIEPSNERFAINCLSLDTLLEKKFKKDFTLVSEEKWGKWNLKKVLTTMPENRPISAPMAVVPDLMAIEKSETSAISAFPIKVYLSWREILSGAVKIPHSLSKELVGAREYLFTETETGNKYTLYYYPAGSYFLGLDEFYKQQDIPQGTSLTLERNGESAFNFWVKKSKKKIFFPRIGYDPATDRFNLSAEDGFSYAEPNKIICLEREALSVLFGLFDQRETLDLKDLLLMVFKNPVLSSSAHAMHFLRAYHLVDLLKQTTQDDVELVLLNSPEFLKSDKKKGIFSYEEPAPIIEMAPVEEPIPAGETVEEVETMEAEPEAAVEAAPEAAPVVEVTEPEVGEEVRPEPAPMMPPAPKAGPSLPSKDKAPKKKKRGKSEGEKAPRPKKSERRVIEEKLAEEESVHAAMSAIKERVDEREEQAQRDRAEDFKPVQKDEPKFGFFAEMLKTALKKKEDPEKDGEEEKEAAGEEKKD